jgi:hypothetical protein
VGLFMTLLYAGHLLVRARLGRTEVRRFIRAGVWLLPPLAFLGLFHLIQLGLWLGGPATPAAAAASAVPTVEAEDWQWTIDPANLGWYRLFYPLTITFLSTPQGLGNISALFVGLLLLPAVTGLRRNFRLDSRLALVGLCALATLLAWVTAIFAIFEIRYVLFLWILLYMVAAKVFERAIENSRQPIRVLASTVVLALLAYMALRTPVIALDTYSPVSLDGQAHCYDSPLCTFLEPLNQSAGPGERVLALNAYRYYLRPDLFACSSRAEEYPPLQPLAHGGSAEFWAEAYRQGFAFVAYEAHFAQRHSRFGKLPDPQRAPDWLRVSVISRDPFGQFVYRIQPLDPPFQPEKTCVQTPGGSWLVQNSR